MARFYSEIQGNRGTATRLGSAMSGIRARVQGWRVGVRIQGFDLNGEDSFNIFATSGSGGHGYDALLGTVHLDADGKPTFTPFVP